MLKNLTDKSTTKFRKNVGKTEEGFYKELQKIPNNEKYIYENL